MNKELSLRQAIYVHEVMSGKSKVQAGLNSGYSSSYCHNVNIGNSPKVKAAIKDVLDAAGVNPDYIAQVLMDGLTVNKQSFHSKKKIPDNDVRQRYTQLILRARGDIEEGSQQTPHLGIIQIPSAPQSIEKRDKQGEGKE